MNLIKNTTECQLDKKQICLMLYSYFLIDVLFHHHLFLNSILRRNKCEKDNNFSAVWFLFFKSVHDTVFKNTKTIILVFSKNSFCYLNLTLYFPYLKKKKNQ